MDYLQYYILTILQLGLILVLNLIINGLPSILKSITRLQNQPAFCFKPYYKWITFNILHLFLLLS